MAMTMKNGPKSVFSEDMEQPWKPSEATSRMGGEASVSALSPKTPLRSISYGNFRGSSSGVGSTAPPPPPTKRSTSVVEEMVIKQRENMSRKLKDLQLTTGRGPQLKVEMPTIVDSRLAKTAALSRSTLRRDSTANYQAVTPASAFSLKGGASPATPSLNLKGSELFPLRPSQSLTSLNRTFDRGLSVFASDDFDKHSTENGLKENRRDTGSAMLSHSLSSSVCAELLADTPPVREIKPAEEQAVEDAIDNIFKDNKTTALTDDVRSASDKQISKHDGSLTRGISPTSGPPLNLKTYPKPQILTKPANLKSSTSKEEKTKTSSVGNAEQNGYKAVSPSPVPIPVAAYTPRNRVILGDSKESNHSRSSVGVVKEQSPTVDHLLATPEKVGQLAKNYSDTADVYRRSQHRSGDDANTRPLPPKPSFNAHLQVDVNKCDLVIPSTSDFDASKFSTRVSTRLGVVSGLQANSTPCFISHQKMDSLLSDSNTVDSGIGRSEAAGSPGSLYQDSADELDNKGYTGWTAPTTDSFNEGRDNQKQQQQLKRKTKKEFVSTAAISLSTPDTETSKSNLEIKPTIKDTGLSTRQSYNQQTSLPASLLRGTPQEPSDHHFKGTQRLSSVQSRSSYSSYSSYTTPNQPTSGFTTLDSKASVEVETSKPVRVSLQKHSREEGVLMPNFDAQSNQKRLTEHRKSTPNNFERNLSESPYSSGSRYMGSRESEISDVKRRAEEDQSLRDLHENEKRVTDEPQRGRIKKTLIGDTEGRKETRMEVTQSYAWNNKNEDKFFHDPHRAGTRTDVNETPEVKKDNKRFHGSWRTETRTDVRQTPEVKAELYVSRDPPLMERTQFRQTLADSPGFELRRQSTGAKKEELTAIQGDDGMIEIEVHLIKGLTGLGFCIEGGIDSPMGDMPITVKRLFKGESAAKGKLQPGDVIVAINGKPMTNKSHYQAWNQLKSLPEGPINLAVRRRGPLPPATLV